MKDTLKLHNMKSSVLELEELKVRISVSLKPSNSVEVQD